MSRRDCSSRVLGLDAIERVLNAGRCMMIIRKRVENQKAKFLSNIKND